MTTNFNDSDVLRKLPKGYMHNLQASNNASTPNTKLDIAAGECRDSTDAIDMALTSSLTINTANTGVLGIDTGSLAASTWYAAYAIKDTSNRLDSSALLSATLDSSPVMPTVDSVTYDAYRLVDYWLTDGSAHFLKGYTVSNGAYRTHYWQASISVLTGGSSTAAAEIDLSSAVPAVAGMVAILQVNHTPASAGGKATLTPFGSAATLAQQVTGSVAGQPNTGILEVPVFLDSGVPKVLYLNSAGSGATSVWVVGYRYPV